MAAMSWRPHMVERDSEPSRSLLIRTGILLSQTPILFLTHLTLITSLESPSPNTDTLEIRASIYELGGRDEGRAFSGGHKHLVH